MSWTKFLPLRFILRRAARSQGFLDPLELLARLRSLAQPSEVGEPIELLRAGVVFHARGLINSRVIQHNLDWVWPYWIERQYDPTDVSFMPRAFSVTHVNLSHRNWTGIGWPDWQEIPLVDPRGLLTPLYDGWSVDAWVITADGRALLPSKAASCKQRLLLEGSPKVVTTTRKETISLTSEASVALRGREPLCRLQLIAEADTDAQLVVALRPQNPEGVSFIHRVALDDDGRTWVVEGKHRIEFDSTPQQHLFSDYREGDVYLHLDRNEQEKAHSCSAGLLTAAAIFPLASDKPAQVSIKIPVNPDPPASFPTQAWEHLQQQTAQLECPDKKYSFLYDAALASLILHSPDDVYPGPYTYKRFWFRDAAFILHAMLCVGMTERVERSLCRFPQRQTALGFFRSQEGEWDSNGEVLWILQRFRDLTGRMPRGEWDKSIRRAGRWIVHKRLDDDLGVLHAGLLPAGFSAEHLGPNDYYYWDNFWSIEGLRAATRLLDDRHPKNRAEFMATADKLEAAVERSLGDCERRLGRPAMPASPYRRMDAGAIGSLATSYPLQQWNPDDPRVMDCVEYLLERCFVDGAFFQDMIHSGLNAYLTLHVAQVLLRNGDPRYLELMDTVANLASPTGQWPEAIHPITKGGCMGDGHHVWASAEWVLMIRNCFVREENQRLILCSGIPERWLQQRSKIRFGPTATAWGAIDLTLLPGDADRWELICTARWRDTQPDIDVRLPGFQSCTLEQGAERITLQRSKEDQ